MSKPAQMTSWSPSQIESLAQEIYALRVSAQGLPGEYDSIFRLVGQDGVSFIMKLMHVGRDASLIDLQCRALEHLALKAPKLSLPRVIPSRQGGLMSAVRSCDGEQYLVWLLSYLPGKTLFESRPHSCELLEKIGEFLGTLDQSLQRFDHPALRRELKWDLCRALWIKEGMQAVHDPARRALIARAIELYQTDAAPLMTCLRKGVIHGDGNDYNILVDWTADGLSRSVALIDFGDMHEGLMVAEPAVAAAYAALGKCEPLWAAASVVGGYHRTMPLEERELQVLFPLMVMRLAVSVVNSAQQRRLRPDDPYVTISEAPAWEALERLLCVPPRFALYAFRDRCGLDPVPDAGRFEKWLHAHRDRLWPIVGTDLAGQRPQSLDLGIGSRLLGADPGRSQGRQRAQAISAELHRRGGTIGVGRYNEVRFTADAVDSIGKDDPIDQLRNVHIGLDIFSDRQLAVCAPVAGVVHRLASTGENPGCDMTVILRHDCGDAPIFYTVYRHLHADSTSDLREGKPVSGGEIIGKAGPDPRVNSGASHLHFQLAMDLLDDTDGVPGMVSAAYRTVWTALCPDPSSILGIIDEESASEWSLEETVSQRRELLGRNLSVSYRKPIKVTRGWRQFLYDQAGRPYLDVFNNVPLVGHSHPRIVEAVCNQIHLLNTNTRYLHENILRYAQRLTALMPSPLRVCYFVNSGSEANELAIRMARAHTTAEDFIVLENAYHGNTGTATDISPYKFNGRGGTGRKQWVHVAPIPDDYRGPYRRGESALGSRYAAQVEALLDDMKSQSRRLAGYIAESVPSVGGQVFFPEGYLEDVYRLVREAGGVCIADEVQVGFGRLGSCFWGFETQNVVPDIVVLAKPIGNCFPLAAVVTTAEIAGSFDNGMEFFSTYGGNPVSCAAGLAVLDVLRDEKLQENALRSGEYLIDRLRGLQRTHPLIGDVRGLGLFLGVDLVKNQISREPATFQAGHVVNRLRERGILTGTDGPYQNVIKLRPPLVIGERDVDLFVDALGEVLGEDLPAC